MYVCIFIHITLKKDNSSMCGNSPFRERSLFMVRVGTEERVICGLKKFYPTVCLSQIFFTPPKENSKVSMHLCLNMVYVVTLPLCSKIIQLPHLIQLIFLSYPTIISSVPTSVINNDRCLISHSYCQVKAHLQLVTCNPVLPVSWSDGWRLNRLPHPSLR